MIDPIVTTLVADTPVTVTVTREVRRIPEAPRYTVTRQPNLAPYVNYLSCGRTTEEAAMAEHDFLVTDTVTRAAAHLTCSCGKRRRTSDESPSSHGPECCTCPRDPSRMGHLAGCLATYPATHQCGPVKGSGILCSDSPVIVSYDCTCGNVDHSWTSHAYSATPTFRLPSGSYPSDARI